MKVFDRRFLTIVVAVTLLGAACNKNNNSPLGPVNTSQPITLTMWQVFDDPQAMAPAIAKYHQIHPNITIQVTTKNYADYELQAANAIAAGTGPDIWMIRNDWLPRQIDKLQAMPDGLLAGSSKKGAQSNTAIVKSRYPDVVTQDATKDGKVYGIPLSIDTLALYYNKDDFQKAGIAQPPSTWGDFVNDVEKLTQYDPKNRKIITHAGAAIGTAQNVNRATDILMLLMLQNGTKMTNADATSSTMNGAIDKPGGGQTFPGTSALDFYTGFADPQKTAYTWNNDLPNSIDAFATDKASMIFSYAYLQRTLLQKNPGLNYGVAPMPQVDGATTPVDYPTYWLEVVSRNTKHPAETWDFLKFMSEQGDQDYQAATGNPTAKRLASVPGPSDRVLSKEQGSPWIFQATTAVDWQRGTNPARIEQIFNDLIENVVTYHQPSQVALDNAAALVTKSLQGGT